jgi:hypothetical protein
MPDKQFTTLSDAVTGHRGKTVKIRCGPATVNGDENRKNSLFGICEWEEAVGRTIHEPGDLSE